MIDQYPYAPPAAASPLKITYSDNAKKASANVIRDIVFSWEKLRLLFNLILLVPSALCIAANMIKHDLAPMAASSTAIGFVLLFNCLYLTLPMLETYICALAKKPAMETLRKFLFTGAVLSSATILVVIGLQTLSQ